MYNQIREEFLKDLTPAIQKSFQMIFNNSMQYENRIGKSLEQMNEIEIKMLIEKYFTGKSLNSLAAKVSLLRRYLRYINNDSAENITREDLRKMIEKYNSVDESKYVSWYELKRAMEDKLELASDKAILILLHIGIHGKEFKEIRHLKTSDIDFINNEIRIKDKIYKFDNYCKRIFEECRDEIGIERKVGEGGKAHQIMEYNYMCEYFIKCRPAENNNNGLDPYKVNGMLNRIYKIMKKLELNTTATDILQSSLADKLFAYEQKYNVAMTRREVATWLKVNEENYSDYDIYILLKYLRNKVKKVN